MSYDSACLTAKCTRCDWRMRPIFGIQVGARFSRIPLGYTGRPSNGNRGLANVWDLSADYKITLSFSTTLYYGHAWGKGVISSIYPRDANGQLISWRPTFTSKCRTTESALAERPQVQTPLQSVDRKHKVLDGPPTSQMEIYIRYHGSMCAHLLASCVKHRRGSISVLVLRATIR